MQFLVEGHRCLAGLAGNVLHDGACRVGCGQEPLVFGGEAFQALGQRVTLLGEAIALRFGTHRNGLHCGFIEDVAITASIAVPCQHLETGNAEGPGAKVVGGRTLVKLGPEHDGDFLHDVVCVCQCGDKRTDKRPQGRLARREQPQKTSVNFFGGRGGDHVGGFRHRIIPQRPASCRRQRLRWTPFAGQSGALFKVFRYWVASREAGRRLACADAELARQLGRRAVALGGGQGDLGPKRSPKGTSLARRRHPLDKEPPNREAPRYQGARDPGFTSTNQRCTLYLLTVSKIISRGSPPLKLYSCLSPADGRIVIF